MDQIPSSIQSQRMKSLVLAVVCSKVSCGREPQVIRKFAELAEP